MLSVRSISRLKLMNGCVSLFSRNASSVNIIDSPHGPCPLPRVSLVQRFFEVASTWPHKTAVECGISGRSYTYDQVRNLSRRFGSRLVRMGFKKGDVFGLVLPNIPEFPIALYGAAGTGMPVTLVNAIYTPEEMARQFRLSETSVIIGVSAMAGTMRQVAQLCPSIRQVILVGESETGFVSFKEMLDDSGDLFDENLDVNIFEDTFVLPSSSGTTGLPKCVMLTNASIATNILQVLQPGTLQLRRATSDYQDIYICVLPFTHIYGLVVQMLCAFDMGSKLVALPKFELNSFLQAIDKNRPTTLHLVPPLVALLAQYPALNVESYARLHTVFSGAAPLSQTLAFRLMDRLNNKDVIFQEGYGLTECSPGSHMSPLGNAKIGSIGSPLSRTQAKIVDLSTGEALGPNQRGELCVKGPQMMKGYLKNPEATGEIIDSSGWLHTGDIAYYDADKHFFIVDRLKELIKVKAAQVSPSELENVIRLHPAVADVAVIGIPDDYAGELPRAYVVKKPGAVLTQEELNHFVDPKVAPHKKLKGGVQFVDSIPKSNTGKILRREIKAAFLQSL